MGVLSVKERCGPSELVWVAVKALKCVTNSRRDWDGLRAIVVIDLTILVLLKSGGQTL